MLKSNLKTLKLSPPNDPARGPGNAERRLENRQNARVLDHAGKAIPSESRDRSGTIPGPLSAQNAVKHGYSGSPSDR